MINEIKVDNIEVMPPNVTQALERASIDCQVATAHAYPRSVAQFNKVAMEYATLDEETAASCIYCRPVGNGKNAEGASVRLAEIVASAWGNIRVQARVIEQTDRYVKCEGACIDLERNSAAKSEVIEATIKRDGTPYDERMRVVIAKAALSKARRDAIFMVVPRAMCKPIIDAAKRVAIGDEKTLESRRKKVEDWVRSLKIDEARVFSALDVKGWKDVGIDQLTTLIGLHTAIKDGDVSVDEAFPAVIKKSKLVNVEQSQKASEELLEQKP